MSTCLRNLNKIQGIECGQQIKSVSHISSIAEGVKECVANSLDAEATEIHVEVDVPNFSYKVADNGVGMPYESFSFVPTRGATLKQATSDIYNYPTTLGFKGRALASICDTATVEIVSRAKGSFETYNKIIVAGQIAKFGLSTEQRHRQGTQVLVRDMFYNMPVRRKACLANGIQKEVHQCRQSVLLLALLHPNVTFTIYDKSRKSFLLRLLKNRDALQLVKDMFGEQALERLAVVRQGPRHGFSVSGHAVLPPHGNSNASHQYVFVNGLPVTAKPLCKMVDQVFGQLYKANDRLTNPERDLAGQRKARNRHAQFVLNICCSRLNYDTSPEPVKALVEFHSWDRLLDVVQLAILQAWKPVLTVACLARLDELEHQEAGGACSAASARGRSGKGHSWVSSASQRREHAAGRPSAMSRGTHNQQSAAAGRSGPGDLEKGAEAKSGPLQRAGRSGFTHSLTSRVVSFGLAGARTTQQPRGAASAGMVAHTGPVDQLKGIGQQGACWFGDDDDVQEGANGLAKRRKVDISVLPWLDAATDKPLFLGDPCGTLGAGQLSGSGNILARVDWPEGLPQRAAHLSRVQLQTELFSNNPIHIRGQLAHAKEQGRLHTSWESMDGAPPSDLQGFLSTGEAAAPGGVAAVGAGVAELEGRQRGMQSAHSLHSWRPLPPAALETIRRSAHPQQALRSDTWQSVSWYKRPCVNLEAGMPLTREEQRLLAAVSAAPPLTAAVGHGTLQRPLSAPPQPKQRSRTVHANPAISLRAAVVGPPWPGTAVGCSQGQGRQDAVPGVTAMLRGSAAKQQPAAAATAGGELICGGLLSWAQQRKPSRASQQVGKQSGGATANTHMSRGLHRGTWATQAPAPHPTPPASSTRRDPPALPFAAVQAAHTSSSPGSASTAVLAATGALQASGSPPPAREVHRGLRSAGAEASALRSTWEPAALGWPPGLESNQQEVPLLQLEEMERSVFAQLKPEGLTRDQLQYARVLAQVDRKFVPVVCGSLVALVDQHAADERVQLEKLRRQLVGSGIRPLQRRTLRLSPPHALHLSQSECQLLETYGQKMRLWGWEWSTGGSDSSMHVLTHTPVVLGTPLTGTDMKLFLHHLEDTCGAGGVPAGVVRVLNSKACRSSIMFGDELMPAQCQDLVDELKQTQLYNSCAHGRPTLAPLVDLQKFQYARDLRCAGQLNKIQLASNGSAGLAMKLRAALHQSGNF